MSTSFAKLGSQISVIQKITQTRNGTIGLSGGMLNQILIDGIIDGLGPTEIAGEIFKGLSAEQKKTIREDDILNWTTFVIKTLPAPTQETTIIVFDRSEQKLYVYPGDDLLGVPIEFPAGNNTTRDSNGPWPSGTYDFSYHKEHPESGPDGPYGSHGNYIFEVSGRTGMGVHAGRQNARGPQHHTHGCVRTTEEGVEHLSEVHETDPITKIIVQD